MAGEVVTPPDPERGERLVEARCMVCHMQASLPHLVQHCTLERGVEYLDVFLTRHHAPDAKARADIIAYLTCPQDLLPPTE
jgi:hypothetical protein